MKENIAIERDNPKCGFEEVIYTDRYNSEFRFYIFPLDHDGRLIEGKVRIENMSGKTIDSTVPNKIKSNVEDWIIERRLENKISSYSIPELPEKNESVRKARQKFANNEMSINEFERILDQNLRA